MIKKTILGVLGCALVISTSGFADDNDVKINQLITEHTQAVANIKKANKPLIAMKDEFSNLYNEQIKEKCDVSNITENTSDVCLNLIKKLFELSKKDSAVKAKIIPLSLKSIEIKQKLIEALQEKAKQQPVVTKK